MSVTCDRCLRHLEVLDTGDSPDRLVTFVRLADPGTRVIEGRVLCSRCDEKLKDALEAARSETVSRFINPVQPQ